MNSNQCGLKMSKNSVLFKKVFSKNDFIQCLNFFHISNAQLSFFTVIMPAEPEVVIDHPLINTRSLHYLQKVVSL